MPEPGSKDNQRVEIVDAADTVLTVMIYPDGRTKIVTSQSRSWVLETLRILLDSLAARDAL